MSPAKRRNEMDIKHRGVELCAWKEDGDAWENYAIDKDGTEKT
jgi:hypothetical protein